MCEPRKLEAAALSWVDLDLDVAIEEDTIEVLDEKVFMEHARTMRIPAM